MAGFISKQPNGLYCRFSTIVDAVTHHNMTIDDYTEVLRERGIPNPEYEAKDTIENYLYPFENVLESWRPHNETREKFDAQLKEMGYKIDISEGKENA